jgi:hypothetical protein
MPAYARSHIVPPDEVGVYHCMARCVRRAFLCGVDPLTKHDYDYRKEWIRERLELLASVFAIDICGYAVMSNHLHVVLRARPDLVRDWSDWVGRCGLHFLRWWEWSQCHEPHVARAAAAWLCRRHTEVSLRELSGWPRVRSNPPGYSERMNPSTVTTIVAGFTRKGDRRRGRDGLLRSSISTVLFSSAATAER